MQTNGILVIKPSMWTVINQENKVAQERLIRQQDNLF